MAFSASGKQALSQNSTGEKLAWEIPSGTRIENDDTGDAKIGNQSPDQRWLVLPSGNDVLLVDLEFKNTPREKAYRESKARPKPWWHLEQATQAEAANDWYAATFHQAWRMKVRPELASTYDNLHNAFDRLKKEYQSNGKDIESVLPAVVRETLALPRGSDVTAE